MLFLRHSVISPPSSVCGTTLPCELLITTLFMFTCIKQLTYYFDSNKCQFLSKLHEKIKESHLTNITYLQVMGRPSWGREIFTIHRGP